MLIMISMKPDPSVPPGWPRMAGWMLAATSLTVAGLMLAPQQLPVSIYKFALVLTSACLGYWLDRSIFPYARPDGHLLDVQGGAESHTISLLMAAAMLRRAVIVAATMLSVGLGA